MYAKGLWHGHTKSPCALQISTAVSAHDSVLKQLGETEHTLADRTHQLAQTSAALEGKQAELSKLSQQHQALRVQHERTEGELSDLTGVLKQKQKDNEALQQRWGFDLTLLTRCWFAGDLHWYRGQHMSAHLVIASSIITTLQRLPSQC